ncbi:MAG: SseB family protein [Hungatella sp.]|nr:SseB family protein [Hungatella sp.]
MAVDHGLIIKKLQGLETLYVSFSQATRMPYVECDPETFDDQVYLFAEEEGAKQWAEEYKEKKIPLVTAKVDKNQMIMFYTSLYLIGVNRLVFNNGAGFTYLPIEQVVTIKKPETEDNAIPRENSTLQLTMIYFLQELRRPGQSPDDVERRKQLREMEQEMVVNLMRSKYIMAIDVSNVEGEFDPKKPGQNIQIPYLKNQQGEIMQPVFSDMWEFQKFSSNYASKLRVASVSFAGLLPSLIKDARGYVLNPAGVNLVLLRDKLEQLAKSVEAAKPQGEQPEAGK